jgi:sulfhydrogenase subunit alpha
MKTIDVPALARVEGEGGLYIGIQDGKAVEIRLDIYEPPRFFEGFLVGRFLQEVPDITARICGICPVAYQMSSVAGLEKALNVQVTPAVYALRRLMYCAEYIESHTLHIYLLQAPDMLGQPSALDLAAIAPQVVKDALRMKKAGNDLLKVIGGRSVHPVNVCVGGFYHWPSRKELEALLSELQWGLQAAKACVGWAVSLPYPTLENDYEFVAIQHPSEYGVMAGEIASSKNGKIPVADFESHYMEEHVQRSNALHGRTISGDPYLVGPISRVNLNHDQLHPNAKQAIADNKIILPINNPFQALVARAVELVHFYAEAIDAIQAYQPEGMPYQEFKLAAGEGCGVSEAPRGLLYHRYKIDEQGMVRYAKITPPTAQNLPRIETDLGALVPQLLELDHEAATLTAEHLVRSYDPCISCATHFLTLRMETIRDE